MVLKDDSIFNLNILFGDDMALMEEYGNNKEKKGIKKGIPKGIRKGEDRIIANLLRAGYSSQKIANDCIIPIDRVNQIKAQQHL